MMRRERERKSGLDRNQKDDEQTMEFREKVMEKNIDTVDDLATIQRNIETAAEEMVIRKQKEH